MTDDRGPATGTYVHQQQTPARPRSKTFWFMLGGCVTLFTCITCLAVAGVAGYFIIWDEGNNGPVAQVEVTAIMATPALPVATPTAAGTLPGNRESAARDAAPAPVPTDVATLLPALAVNPPAEIDQQPVPARAAADLALLFEADYPSYDYYETTMRLSSRDLGPRTVTVAPYTIGDRQSFYNGSGRVEATLVAATEHAYFWVEDGLDLSPASVVKAAERFENDYYPRVVSLFGELWHPGMDNDPRFSVLHTTGAGSSSELGRFNSIDEYPRSLYRNSNEQEIIYLNMQQLTVGSQLYFGTLVHELQHLIQWYVDPNEVLWLNEGLSQLAELYVGLDTAGTAEYLQNPDIRLNSWDFDEDIVFAHYAGSYLYLVYLWEQLGDAAIQELSRHPANGMASIQAVLQGYQPDRSLEQFTADWAAANYLNHPAAGPRYAYKNLDLGRPALEERVAEAPFEVIKELNQYGVHYMELDIRGPTTITFAGDTLAELANAPPHGGEQMWFAPAVDEMNAQLTAAFDLTGVNQATLTFATWYDLEDDYDFAYLSVSTDGGESWELLVPDQARAGEFGPAFNGRSHDVSSAVDGWLKESISLNAYVDRQVLIRFEVLTDSDTAGHGFAIDDIAIPELGYVNDAETGPAGWLASGFLQIGWQIPQQWTVQLIEGGPDPRVTPLLLNELNQGQWTVDVGKGGAVLVVTPLTPFINETATYWLSLEQ